MGHGLRGNYAGRGSPGERSVHRRGGAEVHAEPGTGAAPLTSVPSGVSASPRSDHPRTASFISLAPNDNRAPEGAPARQTCGRALVLGEPDLVPGGRALDRLRRVG